MKSSNLQQPFIPKVRTTKSSMDSTHHLSIDQNGNIMGLVGGTGYVTVYSDDGNKTDTIKIVVESMVKGITISESNFFIDNGLNEYQLEATLISAKSGVEPNRKWYHLENQAIPVLPQYLLRD